MNLQFGFTQAAHNTQFAPLCVIGNTLRRRGHLDSLLNMSQIKQQNRTHTPGEKLQDAFLLILAGYPSLSLLNHHLRPDPVLASAWQRPQLADQSSISRTLDAFDLDALRELRTVSWLFWEQHTRLNSHDWRQPILLDLDLSPLPASPRAQDSTRGYMPKKNKPGAN